MEEEKDETYTEDEAEEETEEEVDGGVGKSSKRRRWTKDGEWEGDAEAGEEEQ